MLKHDAMLRAQKNMCARVVRKVIRLAPTQIFILLGCLPGARRTKNAAVARNHFGIVQPAHFFFTLKRFHILFMSGGKIACFFGAGYMLKFVRMYIKIKRYFILRAWWEFFSAMVGICCTKTNYCFYSGGRYVRGGYVFRKITHYCCMAKWTVWGWLTLSHKGTCPITNWYN